MEWQVDVVQGRYLKVPNTREDNGVWSPQGLIDMHYPEMWGFVQFSPQPVDRGKATFNPAPEEEAKKALREIYYSQRAFRQVHGHYTASLDSLGPEPRRPTGFGWPPVLQVTDHLFEASVAETEELDRDGRLNRWIIRQDSKVWKE